MKEYIVIDPTQYAATKFTKQHDGSWSSIKTEVAPAILEIKCINFVLPFSDIYFEVGI